MIYVYGASDDLIEVDGDISEEFGVYGQCEGEDGMYLAFSNGNLIRVRYTGDWEFTVLHGNAKVFPPSEKVEGQPEYRQDYSGLVVMEDGADWVVLGDKRA